MAHHYGDIKGYKGADGDDIDVFIGDNPESNQLFIVDQIDPKTGAFDEHKVMIGFNSLDEAKAGYLANYEENWQGAGEITAVPEADFKQWLKGDTTKPYRLQPKIAEGLVFRPNGSPYKTENGATFNQAFRNNKGAKVVKVPNGFAVQLKSNNVTKAVEAMKTVINTHSDIPAAVHREDIGDVDFIWGSEGGALTKTGKRKGAKGIAHIIEARMRKDNLSEAQANNIAAEIARVVVTGEISGRVKQSNSENMRITDGVHTAVLSKTADQNAWLLTGWENNEDLSSGETGKGYDKSSPTHIKPTLSRPDVVAEPINSIDQELSKDQSADTTKPEEPDSSVNKDPVSTIEPENKIDDFGEKIGGARKDVWSSFRESLSDEIDSKTVPLSKSFPEPNYAKLAEEGADPQALAMIALMRSYIPNKPRVKYKVSSWAAKVDSVKSFARDLIDGTIPVEDMRRQMMIRKGGGDLLSLAETAPALAKVNPALYKEASKYKIASGNFSIFNGERLGKPTDMYFIEKGGRTDYRTASKSLEDVQAQYVELMNKLESAEKGKSAGRKSAIGIYSSRRTGKVFIGWKGASGVLQIKSGFDSPKEARAYLGENREELETKLAEIKKTPSMRRSVNARREGPERREGNVTSEQFADAFGFRGVEFGNWVENSKRQQDLNEAYDGLIDLAEILEIPPKALSLNGELGLAFGARGKGGKDSAAAHYEPGSIVINLTKKAAPDR